MNRDRLSRSAWVAAGGITLVVVITLLSRGVGEDRRTQAVVPVDPGQAPPVLDPTGKVHSLDRPDVRALEGSEGLNLSSVDKSNRLKDRFIAAKADPGPNGEFHVTQPQWFRYLSPWRVIHLRSDEGSLLAPGHQLQSGELRGNLVVTIFECEEGGRLDLSPDSPHRALRISLPDGCRFDATRNEIRSEGAVHVSTPGGERAELEGHGLQLVYNDVAQRIDYLEITQVDVLRFRPPPRSGSAKKASLNQESGGPTASDGQPPAKPAQYYAVEFANAVTVKSGGESGDTMKADHLKLFFPLAMGSTEPKEAGDKAPVASKEPSGGASNQDVPASDRPSHPKSEGGEEPSRLITITGGGKMVMVPADRPANVEKPEDIYVTFTGQANPVLITLRGETTVHAATVEYLDSLKLLTVEGSGVHPLRIDSPQLGRLSGDRLFARLDEGIGQLEGPGSIRAPDVPLAGLRDDGMPTASSLPPGFSIVWSNSVNIAFGSSGEAADPLLTSATFIGAVRVHQPEPRFDLKAEQVTAEFVPEAAGSRLGSIHAVGDVEVDAEEGFAKADNLRVQFRRGLAGESVPAKLVAEGEAVFSSADGAIAAQFIDIGFLPPEARLKRQSARDLYAATPRVAGVPYADKTPIVSSAEALRAPKPRPVMARPGKEDKSLSGKFASDVASIRAVGGVFLQSDKTRAVAQKFEADNTTGSARLLGTLSDPVVVTGEDGEEPFELRVPRLTLHRDKQTGFGEGAGSLVFTQFVKAKGAATIVEAHTTDPAADPAATPQTRPVKVRWTERMSYDGKAGLIQLVGDVQAEEKQSSTRTHTIRSPQMTLELVDPEVVKKIEGQTPSKPSGSGLIAVDLSGRQVRKFAARGGMVLSASESNPDGGDDLWRFRLEGDRLEYTLAEQVAIIPGPGRMMVIDNRPADSGDGNPASQAAAVSGRGVTVFTWERGIAFNSLDKNMVMEGSVRMTHQPKDGPDLIELWTDRLTADMGRESGVEVIGMQVGSLDINNIEALGSVRIEQGSRVVEAHRVNYSGADETLHLTALPGREVKATDDEKGESFHGREIIWNLKTGRIEVIKPGS